MLLPLPPPEDDRDLLNNRVYWDYGAHPFTLFERCDHVACGKPAVHYLLTTCADGRMYVESRCGACLKLVRKGSPDDEIVHITRDEAASFVAAFSVMES